MGGLFWTVNGPSLIPESLKVDILSWVWSEGHISQEEWSEGHRVVALSMNMEGGVRRSRNVGGLQQLEEAHGFSPGACRREPSPPGTLIFAQCHMSDPPNGKIVRLCFMPLSLW